MPKGENLKKYFTIDDFKSAALSRNQNYRNGKFTIDNFDGYHMPVYGRTKYGKVKMSANKILCGRNPGILSAVDKTEYFTNEILEKQPDLDKLGYRITGQFISYSTKIKVSTPYGDCMSTCVALKNGSLPNIISAVDKTEFFINMAKEVHGDTYLYQKSEYKPKKDGKKTKMVVTCKKHGDYLITPNDHLSGKGCRECGFDLTSDLHRKNPMGWRHDHWKKAAEMSKHFHGYKVYVVKIEVNGVLYFKVGRTYGTIKRRFTKAGIKVIEVISVFNFDDAEECCIFENKLKNLNKEHQINPPEKFGGYTECFYKLNKYNGKS